MVEIQERTNGSVAAGDAVKTEPAAGALGRGRLDGHADRQQGPQAGHGARHRGPAAGRCQDRHQGRRLKVGGVHVRRGRRAARTPSSRRIPRPTQRWPRARGELHRQLRPVAGRPSPSRQERVRGRGPGGARGRGPRGRDPESAPTATSPPATPSRPSLPRVRAFAVGSTVTLTVSKGPKQVTVPEHRGPRARPTPAAIADAELTVGAVPQADERDRPAGTRRRAVRPLRAPSSTRTAPSTTPSRSVRPSSPWARAATSPARRSRRSST